MWLKSQVPQPLPLNLENKGSTNGKGFHMVFWPFKSKTRTLLQGSQNEGSALWYPLMCRRSNKRHTIFCHIFPFIAPLHHGAGYLHFAGRGRSPVLQLHSLVCFIQEFGDQGGRGNVILWHSSEFKKRRCIWLEKFQDYSRIYVLYSGIATMTKKWFSYLYMVRAVVFWAS